MNINDYMNIYSLSIEKNEFQNKKNRIYNILKREIEKDEAYPPKPKKMKRKEWIQEVEKKYEEKIYQKL